MATLQGSYKMKSMTGDDCAPVSIKIKPDCRVGYRCIHANLAYFRVLLKLLGGSIASDKVDVSHKTSA